MCLNKKKNDRLKFAFRNIVCYKFVEVSWSGDLVTPYQRTKIEIGKAYKSPLKNQGYKVEYGLHSLKNSVDCSEVANIFKDENEEIKIIKCIIPFGSFYYKGDFKGFDGYASNKIQYVEEII